MHSLKEKYHYHAKIAQSLLLINRIIITELWDYTSASITCAESKINQARVHRLWGALKADPKE